MPEPKVFFPREIITRTTGTKTHAMDISSAQRYGVPVFGLTAHESPSLAPGPTLNKMKSFVRDYDPEKDFICTAGGDQLGLAMLMLALRDWGVKKVQYLRWERERTPLGEKVRNAGYYVPITVPLV